MDRSKRKRRGYAANDQEMSYQPKVSNDSLFARVFQQFQSDLDMRHDKYERLVKLSRDITIESKRIIFLLHRIDSDKSKQEILSEVQQKMSDIRSTRWHQIALELKDEDPYQFLRAYSPGLQEYIEALSFTYYIEHHCLIGIPEVEKILSFSETDNSLKDQAKQCTEMMPNDGIMQDECVASDSACDKEQNALDQLLTVHVPPTEYMMGLADLTGELMRMAIRCVGRGDFNTPFGLCTFIQSIYNAFLSFGYVSRDMSSKVNVLRQSVRKVEDACYALQVRGTEMPKHLLADVLNSVFIGTSSHDTHDGMSSEDVE